MKFSAIFLYLCFPMLTHLYAAIEKARFQEYTVEIRGFSEDDNLERLIIKKGNEIVFSDQSIGGHYFFGNKTDVSLEMRQPYFKHSITGNDIPNLVMTKWTGGAHCCNYIYVFELGEKFRQIVVVNAQSSEVNIENLDDDNSLEIEFFDGSIDYLFASFGQSPKGRVVLKFHDGEYKVAPTLMRKKYSKTTLDRLKIRLKNSFKKEEGPDLPFDFLQTIMELSYSGHLALALKMTDETWPPNKNGLLNFKTEFQSALQSSPYWRDF